MSTTPSEEIDEEISFEAQDCGEPVTHLEVPRSHISGAYLRDLPPDAMDAVVAALLLQASSARELRVRAIEAEDRLAESLDSRRWLEGERDRLVTERAQLAAQLRECLAESAALKVAGEENSQAVGLLSLAVGLLLDLAPNDQRVPELLFQSARIGVGVKIPLLLQAAGLAPQPQAESAVIIPFPSKSSPSPALPYQTED